MMQVDAHTNPRTYRRCHHVYADLIRPSRCLACGVVDHGPTPHYDPDPVLAAMQWGGTSGYKVGAEPRTRVDKLTDYRDSHGRLTGSAPTAECLVDDRPCRRGHTGRWYIRKNGARSCRACNVLSTQRYRESQRQS
jgi:hypothetical protein